MQFIKKPLKQNVIFAEEAGKILTLEGPVAYSQGDAIITGVLGERWPVRREVFEKTYEPCDGAKYGEPGEFIKRKIAVTAQQATSTQQVMISGEQLLQASIGDWIVQDPSGKRWVVSKEVFEKSYEPLFTEES